MKRLLAISSTRVALLAACLALTGCSGSLMRSIGGGMTDSLRANGVSADATILEIWDTGWTINQNPVIGMKVVVRPGEGSPFEATIRKTTVSRIALPQFQPGRVVPIRFDPKDHTIVAIDFQRRG